MLCRNLSCHCWSFFVTPIVSSTTEIMALVCWNNSWSRLERHDDSFPEDTLLKLQYVRLVWLSILLFNPAEVCILVKIRKMSIITFRGINPNIKTSWTTQTATPPTAPSTRQEASDHQCVLYQYKTRHEHLFTLRTRCSPHHRGLIRLRISDRKSVNHTAEMILWSMILAIV